MQAIRYIKKNRENYSERTSGKIQQIRETTYQKTPFSSYVPTRENIYTISVFSNYTYINLQFETNGLILPLKYKELFAYPQIALEKQYRARPVSLVEHIPKR